MVGRVAGNMYHFILAWGRTIQPTFYRHAGTIKYLDNNPGEDIRSNGYLIENHQIGRECRNLCVMVDTTRFLCTYVPIYFEYRQWLSQVFNDLCWLNSCSIKKHCPKNELFELAFIMYWKICHHQQTSYNSLWLASTIFLTVHSRDI